MTAWTIAWLAWGAGFVVIEALAIARKAPGDTLSEHLRDWFATRNKPRHWRLRRLALAVFFVWFIAHLFLGW